MLDLHNRYGAIVRIAPNELSYVDAQAWKDIYLNPLLERNGVWFRKLSPAEPWSIMGSHEADHARFRRAYMGAFSDQAIKQHSQLLESYVDVMMQKFTDMGAEGSLALNIIDWFNFITFDISGDLCFGESFGSTATGQQHPWVEIACSFGKGIALIASLNFFSPLHKALKYILPTNIRQRAIYHRELSAKKVQQRLELGETRNDFITTLLNYNESKAQPVTIKEMELNSSIMVFAASETTSTAMAAIIFGLLQNPAALHSVTQEIRSAFQSEDEVTVSSTMTLDYLNAAINEGIRLGPPSAVSVPRVVPKEGAIICGQAVPAGTFVGINQYPTFRSPQNFSQPSQFIPERFLEGSNFDDDKDSFHPFLMGRHQCIGIRFAWAEMRLILARLLYVYDISFVSEPNVKDWGAQQTFIFWQKMPMEIRLSKRQR
ncbi:hypothetical protein LTR62_006913 [Meristemomyces frigidus]|uniref:Cytochrome P450 n=1 Tax=Meristemomyces frigidus TaxID=1508187 RepID=A0AAN7TFP6_9PEZI|nr:hypothetical protein LTR62_006913 [Meristemomyces frigidus]